MPKMVFGSLKSQLRKKKKTEIGDDDAKHDDLARGDDFWKKDPEAILLAMLVAKNGFSETRKKKKIEIGDDDAKHDDPEAALGDDLLNEAPEDILLEIFIRLPDSRSAIRTDAVCHKWRSLISKNPQFIPRFKSHHQQHQHRYPLPYTIIFRNAEKLYQFAGPQYYQPICKLFSDQESKFCASTNFLDFITPRSSPMVIRGSCNDLLLVSPGSRWSPHLYICNPFTKQFIKLPEVPKPGYDVVVGHALVCIPGPANKFNFKVVQIQETIYPDSDLLQKTVQPIMLFCSESRKWEMRHFHYPRPKMMYGISWLHSVACNGVLYWLEFERSEINNRVIYLDLSNNKCGVIDFPDDCCDDFLHARVQIGVVRAHGGEELRLLQVVLTTRKVLTVDLNVWKLSDKKEWVLVHHKKKLEKQNRRSYALPFVHPTNGDLVFMVWGQKVFQFSLQGTNTSTHELIGKFEKPSEMSHAGWVAPRDRLLQFAVTHTIWPTQICLT